MSPRSGPKISSSVCQPALARHPPNPVKSSAAAAPPPLDLHSICAPSLRGVKVASSPSGTQVPSDVAPAELRFTPSDPWIPKFRNSLIPLPPAALRPASLSKYVSVQLSPDRPDPHYTVGCSYRTMTQVSACSSTQNRQSASARIN